MYLPYYFSVCNSFVFNQTTLDIKTPVRWSSPEALVNESEVNSKSDVWQFGILSYEVFTHGGKPYERKLTFYLFILSSLLL